jgi:hypothetical protein
MLDLNVYNLFPESLTSNDVVAHGLLPSEFDRRGSVNRTLNDKRVDRVAAVSRVRKDPDAILADSRRWT